jgi:ABC-2 type transport system ATP-binding protein
MSAASGSILSIEGLVKQYKNHRALDGVSLSIQPGEIFGLLGPNGAGKTTLIGMVCGLIHKTAGEILFCEKPLTTEARVNIGLVPQEINFDPFFTVREALELQLGYYGKPVVQSRIEEVLTALSLYEKRDALTRALSGGMKRRLLIAKALVHQPKLVFLDEPTAGVDVELRRDLWSYVKTLRSQGTTVVLTTHYLEEAESLCDRIGIISKGKLLLVEEKTALMRRLGETQLTATFSSPAAHTQFAHGEFSADRNTFSFIERQGTPTCAEVLKALYAANFAVSQVSMQPASLEEVLLHVLGESK